MERQCARVWTKRCTNNHSPGLPARPTHRFAGIGPPKPVAELLSAVESALTFLMDRDWGDAFGPEQKRTFVKMARHTHGCTALCLSGGGAIAM